MIKKLTIAQRNMILHKTATLLEENPNQYEFMSSATPSGEDEQECGCMLAWMNFFSPEPIEDLPLHAGHLDLIAQRFGFGDDMSFYNTCERILEELYQGKHSFQYSASAAATCLREIANNRYPINPPARMREEHSPIED